MKKINSFKSGSIWLNVFETEDGRHIVTINRSFKQNGGWKLTPFFNVDRGDIGNIKNVIRQYVESTEEVVIK
jgi:hypothetical protein